MIKMQNSAMTAAETEYVAEKYFDMLFRLCLGILASTADAEDAVSETYVRYITRAPSFESEEHRRAWLIRVAVNVCKNMTRFRARHRHADIDEAAGQAAEERDTGILESLFALPPKYRTVLYLHYIEGYKTDEMADILNASVSAVKKRLQYARERLKKEYMKGEKML